MIQAMWLHVKDSFTLGTLGRRRWQVFKQNRRGYISLWIFLVLFLLSLFSEFLANDKPILVGFKGGLYMPIFTYYAETDFGGEFEAEADFGDDYIIDLIESEGGWMVFPPIRYDYESLVPSERGPFPAPPDKENWLGTDGNGRDVLARIIYGARISLLFAVFLTFATSIIGIAVGAIQGYFGGLVDLLGQRFLEIWESMPSLFILITVSAFFTPSFSLLLVIMIMFGWTDLVGVVRAEFLRARNFEYVKTAKALGQNDYTIMIKHVLPNAMVATITFMPFIFIGGIGSLTALDYLGYGLPPGSASLGELALQARNNVNAWWIGLSAFAAVTILLSLLVFIGEAIRDAFDPHKTLA